MWIGDFIFEENKTRLNNREKGWNTNKEEKHCIYRREKKGKNVIYHIFDTTLHDSRRREKEKNVIEDHM